MGKTYTGRTPAPQDWGNASDNRRRIQVEFPWPEGVPFTALPAGAKVTIEVPDSECDLLRKASELLAAAYYAVPSGHHLESELTALEGRINDHLDATDG